MISINAETRLVNPFDLVPNAKNAARHPESQLLHLAESYEKFGFVGAVVVGTDNVILAGHGRVEAAIIAHMPLIPVIDISHLSATEQDAYMLADNKLSEQKDWDEEILSAEIARLSALDFDFSGLGIVDSLIDELNADPEHGEKKGKSNEDKQWDTDDDEDGESREERFETLNPRELEVNEEANALPEKVETRVKPGQIWQMNEHRLICGDSTDPENIARLFEKKNAEFCFTSPPYADQRTYNGGKELSTEKLAQFISVASECVDLFAVNLGLSRKNHEVQTYWEDYITAAKGSGLKLLSWNVWDRNQAHTVSQQVAMFAVYHEWIFVFGTKPIELNKTMPNLRAGDEAREVTKRMANGETKKESRNGIREKSNLPTVIRMSAQQARDEYDHPARFPVELPRAYIEACTNPGDTVYEPFGGSGTTLIACEQSHRNCLISELDPSYCDMILTRWEKVSGNAATLVYEPMPEGSVALRKA